MPETHERWQTLEQRDDWLRAEIAAHGRRD